MAQRVGEVGLLERKAELDRIRAACRRAAGAQGAVVLIEGEPGIGKTRLLATAVRLARRSGFTALAARGAELERNFAFGVVRQLFERVVAGASANAATPLLAGAAALAAPLFGAANTPMPEAQDQLLHGLYWLGANLSEPGPVVLAVDDAHWADTPSLRFLTYLARRIEGLPILLIVAARPAQVEGRALFDTLAQEPGSEVMRPAPLSGGASERLVRAALPAADDAFCAACHTATGGNPFLLQELVAEVAARGIDPIGDNSADVRELAPEPVRMSLSARLAPLPRHCSAVARSVAVLERSRLREIAALVELPLRDAGDAVDRLVAAGVLHADEQIEFTHPLLRAAAYAQIQPAERRIAHLRAARVLAAGGRDVDDVAAHLMRAEASDDTWVTETLVDAGQRARARGAPDACAAYLRRVLEDRLDPERRFELLLELGTAEAAAGLPEAVSHLTDVFESAEDPDLRVEAALAVGALLMAAGESRRAIGLLLRGAASLEPSAPDSARRLELESLVLAGVDVSARDLIPESLKRLPPDGDAPIVLVLRANELAMASERGDEAADLAERALKSEAFRQLGVGGSQMFFHMVHVLIYADRFAAARMLLDAAVADAAAAGSEVGFTLASTSRGYSQAVGGLLSDADADVSAALDIATLNGWASLGLLALNILAYVRAEVDPRSALSAIDDAGLDLDELEHTQSATMLIRRGQLRRALGEMEDAAADLLRGGSRFESWGVRNPSPFPWRSEAALALVALSRDDEARKLVQEELELARSWGTPRPIGVALRAAGLVNGGDDGIDRLREAVAVLSSADTRLDHARALVDLGGALRRANHRLDARGPLADGRELARQCGAAALAERARQELVAAGARPRRERLTGVDALTPTERRIARLAAEGRSNPEIAQSLFVTRKTVEFHLSNVYRKLGIHSRAELAEVLGSRSKN